MELYFVHFYCGMALQCVNILQCIYPFLLLTDIWVASRFFAFFFFFLTISNDIVMYIFNHIRVKVSPGKYLRVKLLAWELNDDLVFSKGS